MVAAATVVLLADLAVATAVALLASVLGALPTAPIVCVCLLVLAAFVVSFRGCAGRGSGGPAGRWPMVPSAQVAGCGRHRGVGSDLGGPGGRYPCRCRVWFGALGAVALAPVALSVRIKCYKNFLRVGVTAVWWWWWG